MDVYDFTPIQYPADDLRVLSGEQHNFDFHSIHDNVLKLDILGHMMIRLWFVCYKTYQEWIKVDSTWWFRSYENLWWDWSVRVTPEQIDSNTGTLGIPEFGTKFVRGMLEQTKPSTFTELLQISGLSTVLTYTLEMPKSWFDFIISRSPTLSVVVTTSWCI